MRIVTLGILIAAAFVCGGWIHGSGQINVVTDRYDNANSEWNSSEPTLTVLNAPKLTVKATVSVDAQVDAQPLIYKGNMYVVTSNDTIYEINATTGSIVTSRNVGTPVPAAVSGCDNNDTIIGIQSTPVIDPSAGIIYFVAYTYPSSVPTYTIYAVDSVTLADRITPQVIALSGKLIDNSTYAFNATFSRQRAAIKLANNTLYIAFASFCDFNTDVTRGWLMGASASTLHLTSANGQLINTFTPDTLDIPPFYLTSIWQSGAGPAIDENGNVYVNTGNTGAPNNSSGIYTQTSNLSESTLRFNAELNVLLDYATQGPYNLDFNDADISGSGITLLPTVNNCLTVPNLPAVQVPCTHSMIIGGGKGAGLSTIVADRDNIASCCGSSPPHFFQNPPVNFVDAIGSTGGGGFNTSGYFIASDGILRLANANFFGSGQEVLNIYEVTYPADPFIPGSVDYTRTGPVLQIGSTFNSGAGLPSGQDQSLLYSFSSNGLSAGTDLVWIVGRPTGGSTNTIPPTLYVYDPLTANLLYSHALGNWPNVDGNYDASPVVANGHAYACSYQQCLIFGLP